MVVVEDDHGTITLQFLTKFEIKYIPPRRVVWRIMLTLHYMPLYPVL